MRIVTTRCWIMASPALWAALSCDAPIPVVSFKPPDLTARLRGNFAYVKRKPGPGTEFADHMHAWLARSRARITVRGDRSCEA